MRRLILTVSIVFVLFVAAVLTAFVARGGNVVYRQDGYLTGWTLIDVNNAEWFEQAVDRVIEEADQKYNLNMRGHGFGYGPGRKSTLWPRTETRPIMFSHLQINCGSNPSPLHKEWNDKIDIGALFEKAARQYPEHIGEEEFAKANKDVLADYEKKIVDACIAH